MVASSERTPQQIMKHRLRNTEKEKRRNVDINAAFYNLQCKIPELQTSQRLPRIKTLRLAIGYIQWLQSHLNGMPTVDFAQVVTRVIQEKNSYSARIAEEEKAAGAKLAGREYFSHHSLDSQIQPSLFFSSMPTPYWPNSLASPDSQLSSSP